MPTGQLLTLARIPPFQLPSLCRGRPRGSGRGLPPSARGPGLLHVPVTTALGVQVFAERPRVLCQEAPLWETLPRDPADGDQQTGRSLTADLQGAPERPRCRSFQKLWKVGQILRVPAVSTSSPHPPDPSQTGRGRPHPSPGTVPEEPRRLCVEQNLPHRRHALSAQWIGQMRPDHEEQKDPGTVGCWRTPQGSHEAPANPAPCHSLKLWNLFAAPPEKPSYVLDP
ncbi:uncharacterized protein LOC129677182 [Psammomys obesus]|uniref:uncharacterized protein LOC129677182 n=1 Tax=Psammomys obesus TaxID=48139 RepID=UPI002453574B|nr:uncharacterized protein LOC129677182 [Psammomys obesus]